MPNAISKLPELEYGGRILTPEPRNMSLAAVADLLSVGRTVFVQLEPGDATRYELMLVPQWEPHSSMVLGDDAATPMWLFVTYIRRTSSNESPSKLIRCSHYEGDFQYFSRNEWTPTLLHWWFMCLWLHLGYEHFELRAESTSSSAEGAEAYGPDE